MVFIDSEPPSCFSMSLVLCVRPCLNWPAVERNSPTSEPNLWTVKNHFTPESVNKTTAQFNLVSSNRLSIPAGSPTLNGQWNKKAKHLLHPSQLKVLGETDISQGLWREHEIHHLIHTGTYRIALKTILYTMKQNH